MTPRVPSVDALRGLIMIIMALDHVRDFFHFEAMQFRPEELSRASAALFLTRWITHFCAPVFVFTAGIAARLLLQRGRTKGALSRFLWTRGLWLIFLEVTVVRFALLLAGSPNLLLLEVIWVLGVSMILLAGLIYVPSHLLAPFSVAVIALHNLAGPGQGSGPMGNLLHQQGVFLLGPFVVLTAYPLVPWFAVMAVGYCFGQCFEIDDEERRRRIFAWTGLALTAAFIALRFINVYGNPTPWDGTVLSFLNCEKYPPSLDFLLMTLGPAILLLSRLSEPPDFLLTYGRVPLFFFVAHLYVIHTVAKLAAAWQLGRPDLLFSLTISMASPSRPGSYGFGLPVVYIVWLAVVAAMYPACHLFGELKRQHKGWWLSYL